MEGTLVEAMPTMPPSAAVGLPTGVSADEVIWDEVIAGGGYTALSVPSGTRLRFLDLEGEGCVGLLVHRSDHPTERLNVADTVKVQWQAYLREGQLLLSDMGRVLAAIVSDSSGRHDTICATSNRALNDLRYGDGSIEGSTPNGRDLFALALAKHGRSRRDLAPNVNLFRGTRVDPDGGIRLLPSAPAGSEVVLRCELDVLVTVVNVAHPLDDRSDPRVTPVRLTAWRGEVARHDDALRTATPESTRAYMNSEVARGLIA